MKNKLTQNLLIAAIAGAALVTIVDAQQREKPRGERQIGGQSNRGAPNSLRDGNANRQTIRKPSGGRERDGDNARKPKPGQGRKPGTGMGRSDQQKPKPKPNLRETLDLTEEQAKALHAARKKWSELAKSIHENKELSKEEKQAKVMEGHKRLDAKVREILTEEQYAKLRDLRRRTARPGNREEQAGGQNGQRRPQGGGNEQGRPQRRPQGGGNEQGRPQRRPQGGGNEQGRPQRRLQGGGNEQGRPQRRPQGGGNEQSRPQRRPQGGGNEQSRPQRRPQPKNR